MTLINGSTEQTSARACKCVPAFVPVFYVLLRISFTGA